MILSKLKSFKNENFLLIIALN